MLVPDEAVHFVQRQYTAVMIVGAFILFSKHFEAIVRSLKRYWNISLPSQRPIDASDGEIGLYQPIHPAMIAARSA